MNNILKVKNANGKWVGIDAIRGENGESVYCSVVSSRTVDVTVSQGETEVHEIIAGVPVYIPVSENDVVWNVTYTTEPNDEMPITLIYESTDAKGLNVDANNTATIDFREIATQYGKPLEVSFYSVADNTVTITKSIIKAEVKNASIGVDKLADDVVKKIDAVTEYIGASSDTVDVTVDGADEVTETYELTESNYYLALPVTDADAIWHITFEEGSVDTRVAVQVGDGWDDEMLGLFNDSVDIDFSSCSSEYGTVHAVSIYCPRGRSAFTIVKERRGIISAEVKDGAIGFDKLADDVKTSIGGNAAPISHASTETIYGVGTATDYGHLKITDSLTSTEAGTAASAAALKAVNDAIVAMQESEVEISTDELVLLKTYPYAALSGGGTAKCMCYGGGVFVASDGTNMQYSMDGIEWTKGATFNASFISYGNGKFVALGQNIQDPIRYSTDGKEWYTEDGVTAELIAPDALYEGTTDTMVSLTFCGGKFFAVWLGPSAYRHVSVSEGGIEWTKVNQDFSADPIDIAYGNGVFVLAHKFNKSIRFLTSTDGITWGSATTLQLSYAPGFGRMKLAYIKDRFVCVFQTGEAGATDIYYAYSTTGTSWTNSGSVFSKAVNSILYVHNCFVAPCTDSEGKNAFIYSIDGKTWVYSALRISGAVGGVVYGNNKFIIQSGASLWFSRNLNYCTRGGENLVDSDGLPIMSTNAINSSSSLVINALLGVIE